MFVERRFRFAFAAAALLVSGLLQTGGPAAAETTGLSSLCLNPPRLASEVPGDTPINDQRSINCFAWQSFIALNWPASGGPPSGFGRPGDLSTVAWQKFVDVPNMRIHLRSARVAEPPPADVRPPAPESCPAVETSLTLRQTSKFSFPFSSEQAAPLSRPAWLADRDGNPVLYQIAIDEQEYEYMRSHGLIRAGTQQPRLGLGAHVDMPRGALGGDVGSIEIKAAWLVLPEGSERDATWRRYKLALARIYDEGDRDCRIRVVALVGMHIIHKTTSNPQWIWSTFEHVDNAPDATAVADGTAGDRYRFWSSTCSERAVPQACKTIAVDGCRPQSSSAATTSCAPNAAPAYCLDLFNKECPPYPIQVVRATPIADSGDNLVRQTNAAVQEMIRTGAGDDSVWSYYRLVGTVWSGSPVGENLPGSPPSLKPLSVAGMRPSVNALPLANTTMETYVQGTSCLSCHKGAGIVETGADPRAFAADYSFVLKSMRVGGMTDQEAGTPGAATGAGEARP